MSGALHALKARYTITPLDVGQRTVAIVAEQRVANASTRCELVVLRTVMLGAAGGRPPGIGDPTQVISDHSEQPAVESVMRRTADRRTRRRSLDG